MKGRSPRTAETPSLVVLAPLRVEALALRRGLRGVAGVRVVPTGMGARRSGRGLAAARLPAGTPVVVAGFCGGLGRDVRPGDVIVASEVRSGDEAVPLPAGAPLVTALRRRGLTVHLGPIVSTPSLVTGGARDRLASTGAVAADLESAALVRALGDRPVAVVRVVTDTADGELVRLRLPARALRAARVLRLACPAIAEWSAAARPRRVLLAGPRSFCAGVERAIEVVERLLLREPTVHVRRQIVHNAHVVADLESRGAIFVDELDEVPPGATVVFSAHGVAPAVREDAERRGLSVVDATCPLVTKVHSEARRYVERGDTVLLVGHDGHDETIGTLGEAPGAILLVQTAEEAAAVEVPDPDRLSYVTQTTLADDEVRDVVDVLARRFPRLAGPATSDICYATTNRQHAVRQMAADCDVMLVIGSANSANSRRLVDVAERAGTPAHLVEDATAVDPRWIASAATVGLTAGASAPPILVEKMLQTLAALGGLDVAERTVTTEQIEFTMPKQVS